MITPREKPVPRTPVERAVEQIVDAMKYETAAAHDRQMVYSLQKIPLPEFKRILIQHFHDKSLKDWANLFEIPDPTDPRIAP
jgi:hypothetical protein